MSGKGTSGLPTGTRQKQAAEPVETRAASIEGERARIELNAIPASELGPGDAVDWIWAGYLARGFTTLLIGLWKSGKTTLLAHLLRAAGDGGEIGGEVRPARILVVTEEGGALWARRRDEIGIGDHAHFRIRPFKGRPSRGQWARLIRLITDNVAAGHYDLVVFDTWQTMSPCDDENDAAKMMGALTPLLAIAEAGAAVLLIHHPKKGDADQGQASRGSGALTGFVDTIIELRRFAPEQADDRRRVLRGYSRFDETPAEAVLELRDDGYHTVGSRSDAAQQDRMKVITVVLEHLTEPATVDEIRAAWPEDGIPKPGRRTLQIDLTAGSPERWQQTGPGTRGHPHRYSCVSRTVPPLRTGNESGEVVEAGAEADDHADRTSADSTPATAPTYTPHERRLMNGCPAGTLAAVDAAKRAFAPLGGLTVEAVVSEGTELES